MFGDLLGNIYSTEDLMAEIIIIQQVLINKGILEKDEFKKFFNIEEIQKVKERLKKDRIENFGKIQKEME